MKSIHSFSLASIVLLFIVLVSCTSRQSTDQTGDITDLKDFPKEWVLVDDLAPPDSISRNYIVPVDSSNSFLATLIITKNGNEWQMTNSGFYYPGVYVIKNCKRTTESEMVYYDFDLQNIQDTSQLKLNVNFRHNPDQADNVPSVFTCLTCDNHEDVLMTEKTTVDKFPKRELKTLQYD